LGGYAPFFIRGFYGFNSQFETYYSVQGKIYYHRFYMPKVRAFAGLDAKRLPHLNGILPFIPFVISGTLH
jgi:hypothetical protein